MDLLLPRIPCLGSRSRTGGLSAFGDLGFWLAWSFALLVDTLEHGPSSMIDSFIYHMTARVRSRTLHPPIGAHQKAWQDRKGR